MAVTMAEISKLRTMTGAGMMDCKNALTEANGDFEKALEELYNGFMKLYQMKKKKRKFPGMLPWRM